MSYINRLIPYDQQIQAKQRIHPLRGAIVDTPYRLTGSMFGASADANFWTPTNTGGASAPGIAAGIWTGTSGTANNGFGAIVSVRSGRFLFANPNLWRGSMRVTSAAVTDCTRRFGAFTPATNPYDIPTNGFGFEISAAGVLSCKTWSNGAVANTISSGSFNGDVTSYTITTDVHAWEIIFFVMGAWFFVDGVLLHKFSPTTAILSRTLDLPCAATIFNAAGGTTSGTMESWAMSTLRYGHEETAPQYKFISSNTTTVCKTGPGRLHSIQVGKAGSATNTLDVYDNATGAGTSIWRATGALTGTYDFHLDFFAGMTIITAAGTAAEFTVVYD